MIRAVIFDMFETLITHYGAPLYFGEQMAFDAGIKTEDFLAFWRPTEDARSTGKMTLEEALELVLRENGRYSEGLLKKLVGNRKKAKEECFKHIHPEIIPMLSKIKRAGFRIGLITNCFSEEVQVIRESELFPYFDYACFSYELGVKKPDAEIFMKCAEGLSLLSSDCIYIGDGGCGELESARGLGMKAFQAVWYLKDGTSQSKPKDDFIKLSNPFDILSYLNI